MALRSGTASPTTTAPDSSASTATTADSRRTSGREPTLRLLRESRTEDRDHDRDIGPFPRERDRDRRTDARVATGHQGAATGQPA